MANLPPSVLNNIHFSPVEDFLLAVLRAGLPGLSVQAEVEDQQVMPFVLVRRNDSFGTWSGHPDFVDEAAVIIQCYAENPDGDRDAALLSEAVRRTLYAAWRSQVVIPGIGHMSNCKLTGAPRRGADWAPAAGPVQYADLPSGTYRYESRYAISIRPDLKHTYPMKGAY